MMTQYDAIFDPVMMNHTLKGEINNYESSHQSKKLYPHLDWNANDDNTKQVQI